MTSFYADPTAEDLVELDDGTKIYLLKEMNAGMQEDIQDAMIKLQIKNDQKTGGKASDEDTEAEVHSTNLKMIHMMVTKIELPEGQKFPNGKAILTQPIGMTVFRNMSRGAYAAIVDRINENNRPLSQLRKTEGEAADLVME